jgi:hypothetical protein
MPPQPPVAKPLPIETKSALPPISLEEIAELTKSTYSAARYAPQDIQDLREQAEEAYDAGGLPQGYYPPAKRWDAVRKQKIELKYTPEQLATHRKRGIKLAVYVAKWGASLNMLPEAAWKNIHLINGEVTMGAYALAGAIQNRRDCLSWEEDVTPTKVTIKAIRLLPSGGRKVTNVEVTKEKFKHLLDKDNWKYYGEDMLYCRAVSRVGKRGWPGTTCAMTTTEEARDERIVRRVGVTSEQTPETPMLDDLLAAMEEDAGVDNPEEVSGEVPPATGSQPGQTITGDTPTESPDARLRGELSAATTPAQCIDLHRRAEEIQDAETRKKFRIDVLTRKEQLGTQQ